MESAKQIPQDNGLDNSLALLQEGYKFIQNRCRRFQSDIFETRLVGQKVICMSGEEAARVFYDHERFQRKGAAPKRIQKTLFGENGVQTMDDASHKNRKLLFMSLMTPERIEVLKNLTFTHWQSSVSDWEKKEEIILFDEVQEILCRVACEWAGVPLQESEVQQRADDLGKLVDAFGAIGPRHWQGRLARSRAEEWVGGLIDQVRDQKLEASDDSALQAMAMHRDLDGNLLSTQMASVELINILRPIVAIATYITFSVLALHDFPENVKKVKKNENDFIQLFVHEVRRFYPFGPFLGARVRKDFHWRQNDFKEGELVLLDVYGTNHDPRLWKNPRKFRPERFSHWESSLFDLIPQGGGDVNKTHRCAGELVTVEVMKTSIDFLTNHIDYDVPESQDLSVSLSRIPTLPESRMIIRHVKKK